MRYTVKELLAWGASHSYPQLILIEGSRHEAAYVKHGELNWQRMARDKERRQLAWQRIEQWNARTQERIA